MDPNLAYRMWVSMIGTGLILAGKPVPLVAVSVARAGASVAVRALRGADYLVNEWQGPWVSLGITDDPSWGRLGHSSGGGGPGESLTSTDSPPALHQQGQPVPVVVPAASISAHGGRRGGSKPTYLTPYFRDGEPTGCPPGYHLTKKRYRKGGPLTWVCIKKR